MCRITMAHTIRHHIPSKQLYKRPGPHAPVSLHFHARRRRVWELQSEARIALKKKKKKKEKNIAQGKSGMCCRCETKAKAKTKCKNPELSWDCFIYYLCVCRRMMDSNPAHDTCHMFF